jgi:hypothetical protein
MLPKLSEAPHENGNSHPRPPWTSAQFAVLMLTLSVLALLLQGGFAFLVLAVGEKIAGGEVTLTLLGWTALFLYCSGWAMAVATFFSFRSVSIKIAAALVVAVYAFIFAVSRDWIF